MDIDFKSAAKFNDELIVSTTVSRLKKVSVEFEQIIKNKNEQLVFSAKVQVACVNTTVMKPMAIPELILGVLK
mgnify:CR=1 FL=1